MNRCAKLIATSICLFVLLLVGVSTATADTITIDFYTTGVFCAQSDCSTSTTSVGNSNDSVSLSFTGVGSSSTPIEVLNNPDSPGFSGPLSLGTFTVTRGDNSAQFNLGGYFDLSIFQSVPSAGTGNLLATLTGQIKSNGTVDFSSDPSTSIGIVTYLLPNGIVTLTNPDQNSSTQSQVFADISHTDTRAPAPVPEPASLLLCGTGLLAVARRFRTVRPARKA